MQKYVVNRQHSVQYVRNRQCSVQYLRKRQHSVQQGRKRQCYVQHVRNRVQTTGKCWETLYDIDWQMTYNVNGRPPLVGKFFSLCIGFMLSIPPRRLGQGEYQLLWQRRHVISAVSEVYKKLLLAPFCSPSFEHQVFQDVGLTRKVQKHWSGYSSFILAQGPLHLSVLFWRTLVLVFKHYIGFIGYQDGVLTK